MQQNDRSRRNRRSSKRLFDEASVRRNVRQLYVCSTNCPATNCWSTNCPSLSELRVDGDKSCFFLFLSGRLVLFSLSVPPLVTITIFFLNFFFLLSRVMRGFGGLWEWVGISLLGFLFFLGSWLISSPLVNSTMFLVIF